MICCDVGTHRDIVSRPKCRKPQWRNSFSSATSSIEDGGFTETFAAKIKNFTSTNPRAEFKGPLKFLKSWTYQLGEGALEGLLTAPGSATEFTSGVRFWTQYGRLLYNATAGQPRYNASLVKKGTKPVLRATSQARILQSAEYWATGFFGFNSTDNYDLVIIPEGGTENNTLASYDSCLDDGNSSIYYIGDHAAVSQISIWEWCLFRSSARSITFLIISNQPRLVSQATSPMALTWT